jgi:hypothetical protein
VVTVAATAGETVVATVEATAMPVVITARRPPVTAPAIMAAQAPSAMPQPVMRQVRPLDIPDTPPQGGNWLLPPEH